MRWDGVWLGCSVLLLMLGIASTAPAFEDITVYRLAQFDVLNGQHKGTLGTSRTRLSQRVTTPLAGTEYLQRRTVVVNLTNPDVDIEALIKAGPGALLLVLPQGFSHTALPAADLQRWRAMERHLVSRLVAPAVYFAQDSEGLGRLVQEVESSIRGGSKPTPTSAGYVIKLEPPLPTRMDRWPGVNIQGWLAGSENRQLTLSSLPLVAVVAHHDALASAPALSAGANGNGSGVAALLMLARIFARAFAERRPNYNMIFVLTGGGPFNYAGAADWVATLDPRSRQQLEFVLCLDSLAGGPGAEAAGGGDAEPALHLHYSKPPKDPSVKEWYGAFERAAEKAKVGLGLSHKKVNVAAPLLSWEHEAASKARLFGATLSSLHASERASGPDGTLHLIRGSVFDQAAQLGLDTRDGSGGGESGGAAGGAAAPGIARLATAVEVAAGALATRMWPSTGGRGPSKEALKADRALLARWVRRLASEMPRAGPLLNATSSLLPELRKALAGSPLNSTLVMRFNPPVGPGSGIALYSPFSGTAQVFRVQSLVADTAITLGIGLYLLALFSVLCVSTRGWGDLKATFQPGGTGGGGGSKAGKAQ